MNDFPHWRRRWIATTTVDTSRTYYGDEPCLLCGGVEPRVGRHAPCDPCLEAYHRGAYGGDDSVVPGGEKLGEVCLP